MTQTSLNKLHRWTTGEIMGKPQPLRDAIGQKSFNTQFNYDCRCEISDSPEGAVICAFIASHVTFSRKVVFASMSMEAEILASMTKDGVSMSPERAAYFGTQDILLKKNPDPYRSGYVAVGCYEPIGYMVPVDFHRPEPVVEAILVQPATVNLTTAAARFVKTLATALGANGSEIDVDGAKVIAAPRSATLGLYSVQHDNADTARRVHDRDIDAAIDAGIVGRKTIDAGVWLYRQRQEVPSQPAL